MKHSTTILILFLSILQSFGQADSAKKENDFELYGKSDVAKFIDGGIEGLMKFIFDNIQYPEEAQKDSVSGVVFVVFTIDKKGLVKDVEATNIKIGYGLEEEVIRVVKLTSGMWIPAKKRKKIVSTRFRLPVRFELN